jgi:hypothetical protein
MKQMARSSFFPSALTCTHARTQLEQHVMNRSIDLHQEGNGQMHTHFAHPFSIQPLHTWTSEQTPTCTYNRTEFIY